MVRLWEKKSLLLEVDVVVDNNRGCPHQALLQVLTFLIFSQFY
jgi:hypothetical protein